MWKLVLIVLMTFVTVCADEDQPTFKTQKAILAQRALDQRMEAAEKLFKTQVKKALQEYQGAMKLAVVDATQKGDLDDANLINQKIKEAEAKMESLQEEVPGSKVVTLRIRADSPKWISVGNVQKGQVFLIKANPGRGTNPTNDYIMAVWQLYVKLVHRNFLPSQFLYLPH